MLRTCSSPTSLRLTAAAAVATATLFASQRQVAACMSSHPFTAGELDQSKTLIEHELCMSLDDGDDGKVSWKVSHAFLSSSRQQRPTSNMEAHITHEAAVRRTLEQASVGASSCLLLDTARSPWAPAQAPRVVLGWLESHDHGATTAAVVAIHNGAAKDGEPRPSSTWLSARP
jgi:hypothetical protein